MNEKELRQKVADTINAWVGAVKGDAVHAEILRIYNSHRPLARGYTVQKGDAYCATTASAAYISTGMADFTGTECGVDPWIKIAQGLGIWVENDAHRPGIGDAIIYDWEDSGSGENLGYPDHIGIVTAINGNYMTITEGNMSGGKVGRRTIGVNDRYIRGFICPDFAAAAKALDPETPIADDVDVEPTNERDRLLAILGDRWIETYHDVPESVALEVMELIHLGALKGTKVVDNPEDTAIHMPWSSVRVMVICLRTVKALAGAADKAALAEALAAVAEALKQ